MAPVIVVESAGKQRVISDLVRKASLDDWVVVSCSGHYCGLPKTQVGLDPKTLEFTWKVRNIQAFERVKKAVAAADVVYAATDFSPEGEAIANQISITANYAKKPFHRLRLLALDAEALKSAIAAPSTIDEKILQAYLAREVVDRLVQFVLSPVLAARLGEGLQLHRVAIALLSELARVERKIRRFKPSPYNIVRALLSDGSTAESLPLPLDKAEEIVRRAKTAVPAFSRAKTPNPVEPPFTLSSLIQFSSKRYGIDALSVVKACETLYGMGLITYPYTDSCWLPPEVTKAVHSYVSDKLSSAFAGEEPNFFSQPSLLEAIRPVQLTAIPSQLDLARDLRSLYSAIWFRTMGSQGRTAQVERQLAVYSIGDEEVFRAEGLTLAESGWHQLSGRLFEPPTRPLEADATVVDASIFSTSSKPPKRHTHGTLVAWMDQHFISRPWAYLPALEFLQDNLYVETLGGGLLRITDRGEAVLTFVRRSAKDLVDPEFCAGLEEEISAVEQGRCSFDQFCRTRWQWVTKTATAMSTRSLRPEFTSPAGQKLKVYIDKESGRPFVRPTGEEWWSHVTFDEKGKIIVKPEEVLGR